MVRCKYNTHFTGLMEVLTQVFMFNTGLTVFTFFVSGAHLALDFNLRICQPSSHLFHES